MRETCLRQMRPLQWLRNVKGEKLTLKGCASKYFLDVAHSCTIGGTRSIMGKERQVLLFPNHPQLSTLHTKLSVGTISHNTYCGKIWIIPSEESQPQEELSNMNVQLFALHACCFFLRNPKRFLQERKEYYQIYSRKVLLLGHWLCVSH